MASSHSAEEALPVGLLEFIGSMVETDGRLIDPLSLETPADVVLAEGPDGDMAEREKVEDKR